MSGASFVVGINFVVAGLLAASFIAIALQDARLTAPRWFASAYFFAMFYFAAQLVVHMLGGGAIMDVLGFSLMLAGFALFNVGLARKYGVAVPWRVISVAFLLSVVICAAIQGMPRTSFWRMFAFQSPFFVMLALGVWIIRMAPVRGRLDVLLQVAMVVSAPQFLARPFLLQFAGGMGATVEDYLDTDYALISQTISAITGTAIALLAIMIAVRDVLAEVIARSEIDTLSGLLNRRGFERHAAATMERSVRQGMPFSLIIADMDHFKSINDTFGHLAGDHVIQVFSGFLRGAAGGQQVAARLGGEEFAIVLPGSNLMAARLFAEGVRSAFSALPIDGLLAGTHATASFGVAELVPSEGLPTLMQRADEALYAAKRAGRNCVQIAHLADQHRAASAVAR